MSDQSCVGVLLFAADGKLLLQFRDAQAPTYPHKWCLFGGGLEDDENPVVAAHREIQEELDFYEALSYYELVGTMDRSVGHRHVVRFNDTISWGEFAVKEGAAAGFFSKEDALTLDLTPGTRAVIERFV